MSLGSLIAVAIAEAFRGDGEILASPMGPMPSLGVSLARHTFEPDLVCTDGVGHLIDIDGRREGWMPYRRVFDTVWWGRRHVMMGASQIDQWGRQNISAIGPHNQPKVQLLGVRGAPGNTVHHTTSYWVPRHSNRVFVPDVDVISGVGPRDGAHEIRAIITNLGVLDTSGPDGRLAIRSLHPRVTIEQIQDATGFALHVPSQVPITRSPNALEIDLLDTLDPDERIRSQVQP